ncbi:uncharacterized protein LOC141595951 isoform X2 [Silene latifolia]|uniref:uncharacterized protein LOC141595951 isoform X2 n=1 Tax=Silene latifolia TaxID=37657 RepID=UPI003D77BCD0
MPNPNRPAQTRPESYAHSPAHYYVLTRDHTSLTRLTSTLPKLQNPIRIRTESDSLTQDSLANQISAALDRRDVPNRETALHLAVRLNDAVSANILASAGADVSLQNDAGWNPLQEAVCRRLNEVAGVLARWHHLNAWAKWRRRLPRVVAVLRRMRDFYLEIEFRFESSIVPFIGKIAPSDTYRIWKRDGNLRADTTLAGFDGMKIQRADQSFLFLGDGDEENAVPEGSLLVLNRDDRKIFDAFENAGVPMTDEDVANFCSQTTVYRPGMDVTAAELVSRTNWRRQEKIESVGDYKSKVYEMHNVLFSFRSRKVIGDDNGGRREEQVLPLELDEEEGFLVAENPTDFGFCDGNDRRRHSSFVRGEREWVSVGRKSVDINFAPSVAKTGERRRASSVTAAERPALVVMPAVEAATKEKEYVKSLRPSVWLTDDFPLKTEEVLPLLDILANKVKAVRRMRELLTTKFPAGSFPVKIAIPVVPTVRVVITFTKFVELQPTDLFYTPLSSPRFLSNGNGSPENQADSRFKSGSSWLRRPHNNRSSNKPKQHCPEALIPEPFAIPREYSWESIDSKKRKMKKSKSVRKSNGSTQL